MKQPINIHYDGDTVRFERLSDELAYRDYMLNTICSYTSCRAKWLVEQKHLPAAVWAVDLLRQFTGAYKKHSLLAVAKRCLKLEHQLQVLMPNPEGKMSHWCKKIELVVKISQAIVNDEQYYLSGLRYGQAARPGQFPAEGSAAYRF